MASILMQYRAKFAGAVFIVLAALAAGPAVSAPPPSLEGSGLPLPRFVSLLANEVNLRSGPSVNYPVEWVYQRQNLPVEIIAEYRTWRKIRDWQGTQGWVHQSTVGGFRTIIVTGATRTIRSAKSAKSQPVVQAEAGVIGQLLECPANDSWCKVEVGGHEGWLRKVDFWGAHRDEEVD